MPESRIVSRGKNSTSKVFKKYVSIGRTLVARKTTKIKTSFHMDVRIKMTETGTMPIRMVSFCVNILILELISET